MSAVTQSPLILEGNPPFVSPAAETREKLLAATARGLANREVRRLAFFLVPFEPRQRRTNERAMHGTVFNRHRCRWSGKRLGLLHRSVHARLLGGRARD